jgi:hypothetical protein
MSFYPSFTEEFVWDKLEMQRGWAYYAWAFDNEAKKHFVGVKFASPAYVRQESDKLIEEAHRIWNEQKQ